MSQALIAEWLLMTFGSKNFLGFLGKFDWLTWGFLECLFLPANLEDAATLGKSRAGDDTGLLGVLEGVGE